MEKASTIKRILFPDIAVDYDSHELAQDIIHANNLCQEYDFNHIYHDVERLDDRAAIKLFLDEKPLTAMEYSLITNKDSTRLVIHCTQLNTSRLLFKGFDTSVVPNQPIVVLSE